MKMWQGREKLFRGKTSNVGYQLFRYLLTGGLAFCVDFATLWCLTEYVGIHYLLSATIAFMVGLGITYGMSIVWIFSERRLTNVLAEFIVFTMIGIVGMGLNELVIWLCTDFLQWHYMLSKFLSVVVVTAWNFPTKRLILFRANR